MITCPNCGAVNKEGSSACRMCATSLSGIVEVALNQTRDVAVDGVQPTEPKEEKSPVEPEGITCPECKTLNEAGWSFCQQCGKKLPESATASKADIESKPPSPFKTVPEKQPEIDASVLKTVPEKKPDLIQAIKTDSEEASERQPKPARAEPKLAESDSESSSSPTIVVESGSRSKVAGSPKQAIRQPGAESTAEPTTQHVHSVSGVLCTQCGQSNAVGSTTCASCGAAITFGKTKVMSSMSPTGRGRLHLVMEGGQPGEVYDLGDETTVGRTSGDITFPHDGFMSGRHARVIRRGDAFVLVDEASRNGTFIKIKGDIELESGDMILIGKQLFRFEA